MHPFQSKTRGEQPPGPVQKLVALSETPPALPLGLLHHEQWRGACEHWRVACSSTGPGRSFPGSYPIHLAPSSSSLQPPSAFRTCAGIWAMGCAFSAEIAACVKTLELILPSLLGKREHQQGLPGAVKAAAVSAVLPAARIKGTYGVCTCWHQRNHLGSSYVSDAKGKC